MSFRLRVCLLATLSGLCACASAPVQWPPPEEQPKFPSAREINAIARPDAAHSVAIVGATLVDGRGGPPVRDAVVVVRGDRVVAAGARAATDVPAGAEVVPGAGLSVLPGLIDAHFHLDGDDGLPALFLQRGVTSLRAPGQWVEAYDAARKLGPVPRLFLAGPLLDGPARARPESAMRVRGAAAPTLAFVERRAGNEGATEAQALGFENRMKLAGAARPARRAGVRVVVGSHGTAPRAERGWAYQREMELLVESGLSPMEVLVAGTLENARFLGIDDRLGSIQPGKLADLVLIEGDPLADIRAMRRVKQVMLNGRWVDAPGGD
ncbi:amidohydrolase family protein [Sorangium sp. So ce1182]|uniref:amidohydrolase family protein n=1 Tax=Sorangium sp. So ce1182 TaxID=3133334 RepID=UPI003F604D8B